MGGLFGIYNSRRGETHPAQKGENQIDAGQSRGCAPLKRLSESRWISGWGRQRKSSTKKEAEVDIFFGVFPDKRQQRDEKREKEKATLHL